MTTNELLERIFSDKTFDIIEKSLYVLFGVLLSFLLILYCFVW